MNNGIYKDLNNLVDYCSNKNNPMEDRIKLYHLLTMYCKFNNISLEHVDYNFTDIKKAITRSNKK